jgi:hypothetical protein
MQEWPLVVAGLCPPRPPTEAPERALKAEKGQKHRPHCLTTMTGKGGGAEEAGNSGEEFITRNVISSSETGRPKTTLRNFLKQPIHITHNPSSTS